MTTPVLEKPIPPVPSAQTLDSRGSTISQPWQQWFINLRDKVNQINGVVVAISGSNTTLGAFNTLSPLTTTGDMLTYGSGNNTRLPIGSTGQILAVVSGMPAWVNPSAGSTPLTTKGDLYGYNTAPARIPVGTDSYVLTADSTNVLGVSWKPAGTPTLPITTKGDILGYDTAANRIPVGTDSYVLTADSSSPLGVSWKPTGTPTLPVTTKGDLLGYDTAANRVPIGTNGYVLTADSTQTLGLKWAPVSATYTPPVTSKGDLFGYGSSPTRIPVGTDGQVLTARSSTTYGVAWENSLTNYVIPPFSSVISLLHFSGAVGSSTFTDQIVSNTWTAGSGATISSTHTIVNTTSGYFNGTTSAYITMPSSSSFNFGNNNFTIEFSCYLVSGTPSVGQIIRLNYISSGGAYGSFLITVSSVGLLSIYLSYSGTAWDISSWNPAGILINSWSRVLIQRVAGVLQCYINGALTGTVPISGSLYYASGNNNSWGGLPAPSVSSALMYLNECRIVNGEALVFSYTPLVTEFPNS